MDQYKELISQGKLKQAIDKLIADLTDKDSDSMRQVRDDILLLKANLSEIHRQERLSLVKLSESAIEKNKIRDALLKTINDLQQEIENAEDHANANIHDGEQEADHVIDQNIQEDKKDILDDNDKKLNKWWIITPVSIGFMAIAIFLLSGLISNSGSITYGDQTYKWKKLKDGNKWLTENLRIKKDGSWCYDKECERYGLYYTWEAANSACSDLGDGWSLPTKKEWENLAVTYGGYELKLSGNDSEHYMNPEEAGKKLIGELITANQHAGIRRPDGTWDYVNKSTDFWSATKYGIDNGYGVYHLFRLHKETNHAILYAYSTIYGLSCRCVKRPG